MPHAHKKPGFLKKPGFSGPHKDEKCSIWPVAAGATIEKGIANSDL
jgi:hypothetical protein